MNKKCCNCPDEAYKFNLKCVDCGVADWVMCFDCWNTHIVFDLYTIKPEDYPIKTVECPPCWYKNHTWRAPIIVLDENF